MNRVVTIYRYKRDGKLYTLYKVGMATHTGYWLEAEPYGHHGPKLGKPRGRGQLKEEDFEIHATI